MNFYYFWLFFPWWKKKKKEKKLQFIIKFSLLKQKNYMKISFTSEVSLGKRMQNQCRTQKKKLCRLPIAVLHPFYKINDLYKENHAIPEPKQMEKILRKLRTRDRERIKSSGAIKSAYLRARYANRTSFFFILLWTTGCALPSLLYPIKLCNLILFFGSLMESIQWICFLQCNRFPLCVCVFVCLCKMKC